MTKPSPKKGQILQAQLNCWNMFFRHRDWMQPLKALSAAHSNGFDHGSCRGVPRTSIEGMDFQGFNSIPRHCIARCVQPIHQCQSAGATRASNRGMCEAGWMDAHYWKVPSVFDWGSGQQHSPSFVGVTLVELGTSGFISEISNCQINTFHVWDI